MPTSTLIVTRIKRNSNSSISHLSGGSGSTAWEHSSLHAKRCIERGTHHYRVGTANGPCVEVVNRTNGGWYLRSQPDSSKDNNLEDLPEY